MNEHTVKGEGMSGKDKTPEPERKFERAPAWRHFSTFVRGRPDLAPGPSDTRHHGSIGVRTFSDQSAAEDYLRALPEPYSGRCYKSENGKWTVAYRRFDVPDPTSKRGGN